jgi:hypothetical protein
MKGEDVVSTVGLAGAKNIADVAGQSPAWF